MPDNRCMGCMKELDAGASVCPHCGFDKDKYISPEMTLPPGSVLANGKYLIGKTLGQGGFGVTYIALDQFLELRVAIKEYLPRNMAYRDGNSATLHWHSSITDKRFGRDSFVKEAKKMAKMDDIPGIVRVKEVFYENDTAYIVMDYVEGDTLLRRLEKTGALDGKACFALLRPVMDSLAEAHRQGMIHRDISPDNIMLDKRGRIWLLDMGAAKELDMAQSGQGGHNSTTMIVKPGFSPLEQYASGGDIGPWTDVYAMCATIFFCMSGSTLPLATDRVLNPRLELPAIIPPHISQVLLKGLAVMPDDRIRSMEELRDAFAAALDAPDDAESRRRKEAEARQEAERRQAEESARQAAEEEAERQRVEEKQREWQRKIAESKERAKARHQKEEAEARQEAEEEAERQRVEQERQQAQTARQTKKPLLFVIFAVILAGAVLVLSNLSHGGECGNNATWTLDRNGLLTISGSGAMNSFHDSPAPWWYGRREEIISVDIENGIANISAHAFEDCANLVSVTIPDSVTEIGYQAFRGCYSLSSVSIPDSVTTIGVEAFWGCRSLSSIAIPDGVTEIESRAFKSCSSLSSVTIPDSVTTIGVEAFWGCDSLSSVTIPDSVTRIGYTAFWGCRSLSSVSIPGSVTEIEFGAFKSCSSLSSVSISGGVGEIGNETFEGCSSLSSVVIPDSVTAIGRDVFSGCSSLSGITIPDSVTAIGEGAFRNCSSLSSITIPDGVTEIGSEAFKGCSSLNYITIPGRVKTIGEKAFADCDNLEGVSLMGNPEIAEDAFPENMTFIRW